MMTHDWSDRIRKINAAENLRADRRVDFHFFKLGGRQAAGLVDDVRGHCKFADVVKQRSGFQRRNFSLRKSQAPRPGLRRRFERDARGNACV